MKRPRGKSVGAGRSPARRSLRRRRIESEEPDEEESLPCPSRPLLPKSDEDNDDDDDNASRKEEEKEREKAEPINGAHRIPQGRDGLNRSPRRSRGFAYLREGAPNHTEKEAERNEPPAARPSPTPGYALEEEGVLFASPRSAVSTTRGFSHLRESISFAIPHPGGGATPRGSVIIPTATPLRPNEGAALGTSFPPLPPRPPAAASRRALTSGRPHGTVSGSQSSFSSLSRSDREAGHAAWRPRVSRHGEGSVHSFLSTHSAIEYLNSTGSIGEVLSSRESRRSSPTTASRHSVSKSTLGPLDLSPILKEERRPRRRRPSPRRHQPTNGIPIDVPTSILSYPTTGGGGGDGFAVNAVAAAAAAAQRERMEALESFRRGVARWTRRFLCVMLTFFLCSFWGLMVAPLMMRLDRAEDAFVRDHVDTISEAQFIYEVPYMSLSANATRRLYLRVLSEAMERVERATESRKPPDDDVSGQLLYVKRMLRVYQTVRYRSRLYARSRDRNRLYQYLLYPLRDAWVYGFMRHGWTITMREVFWEPSWRRIWARLLDVAVCLRQDEKLPCPTLTYLQEKQEEADVVDSESNAVGSDTRGALERLRRLLEYVRQSSRRSNRDYNHLYTGEAVRSLAT